MKPSIQKITTQMLMPITIHSLRPNGGVLDDSSARRLSAVTISVLERPVARETPGGRLELPLGFLEQQQQPTTPAVAIRVASLTAACRRLELSQLRRLAQLRRVGVEGEAAPAHQCGRDWEGGGEQGSKRH